MSNDLSFIYNKYCYLYWSASAYEAIFFKGIFPTSASKNVSQ